MSLTDEQCRAMEAWANTTMCAENTQLQMLNTIQEKKIVLLEAENATLKARVEAAEELIEALDDDIRIHRDEMSNIKRASPYADAICQHLVLKVQPAKNKWEALK